MDSEFSIKTPYTQELYKAKETSYQNNKWKHLSIFQNDKVIAKLHGEVLEDDGFKDTLDLFETNTQLSIPEDLNPFPIEILAKYFYLKEIPPIMLQDLFPLFQLAFFLKVNPLIIQIQEYLLNQIHTPEKTIEIFRGCIEFILCFPDKNIEFIREIFKESMVFLMNNNKSDDILKNFNVKFFQKIANSIVEQTFEFFIGILKGNNASNEILMEFLLLFRKSLISYFIGQNANFNKEKYYQRFIEKYLDLANVDMKNIADYLTKLEVDGNFEIKDLMISAMSDNIADNKRKINELENKFNESQTMIKDLNQKIQDFEQKTEKKLQDFEGKNKNKWKSFEEKHQNEMKNFNIAMRNHEEEKKISLDERFRIFEENLINKLKNEEEERQKVDNLVKKILIYGLDEYRFCSDGISNKCFLISNSNTTVEKISHHKNWDEIRCNERVCLKSLDKRIFSIKIENLTNFPHILIGFCMKTAENSNQFSSFMLSLCYGQFCSRSTCSDYLNLNNNFQPASVNQIYTTILDVKQKSMTFLLNGKVLGYPRNIDVKPEEIDLLCPCVDIWNHGDKMSLVKDFCDWR